MQHFKINIKGEGRNLSKFHGILYVGNIYFITVFIDVNHHTVETYDSLQVQKAFSDDDSVLKVMKEDTTDVLMRKWIAKSISIIDYFVNEKDNEKDMSF